MKKNVRIVEEGNNNFSYDLQPGKNLNLLEYSNHRNIISIITATYNPTDYLLQTANCILNQTYPYFEWIIVDDGSTKSESKKLLKELEKMDTRIKIYYNDNKGPSIARDYGVEKSDENTKYILFIDDDDLLEKTFLEISYFSMCANPNASWCYSDVVNFQGQNLLWNRMFDAELMAKENLLVNTALIKKDAFLSVGGFHLEGHGLWEDWILWLKLLSKGHYPIHMSYYGFWYRKKESGSELNKANSKEKYRQNKYMIKSYAKNVDLSILPIEFPRENYCWDVMVDKNSEFVEPKYKKNKKTNILVMVPWMTLGGADKFNLDLFKMMDRDKFSVTLVSMQPTEYVWRQKFEEACDYVYDLSTFIDRKDWISFINHLIESKNIDIIFNTNSLTGYMMLPYLHARYPKIPILDYIHMEEWYNRNGGYSRDSAAVSSIIDRTLFCNGKSEHIMNEYFGVDDNKLGTVYIGVDADKFDPSKYDKKILRQKYDISEEKFVISLIARIDYQKRPYLLMRIVESLVNSNKISNALFLIAGDGPLLNSIKNIAQKKNLDDYIKFIGISKNPQEVYAISDVTLNCSIKEGLALTAYESLSMGVPVVSADVGGQKELITEDTGVIVPCIQNENDIHNYNYSTDEVNGYVDALIKVYKDNDKFKNACRKRILSSFTIQKMVENMTIEFENLSHLKKENHIELSKHISIFKELFNQYLLGDKGQYNWLCKEYYIKVYRYIKDDRTLFVRIKNSIGQKMWKYKIYRKFISLLKKLNIIGKELEK